jgi:hypothetical protein
MNSHDNTDAGHRDAGTVAAVATQEAEGTRLPSRRRLLLLSLAVPVAFLLVGLVTLNDYGETWDEQFDQDIGRYYVNDWGTRGAAGLEARFIPMQRNYGPLFDVIVVTGRTLFHDRLKLVSSQVASYHVAVLVAAALGLWLVFWLGCRWWGLGYGVLAALLLALMPQFIAHSQNNLKDTPLMVFFVLGILAFYEAVRRERLRFYVLAGVAAGLTYAVRVQALALFPIVLAWQALVGGRTRRQWLRLLAGLALAALVAAAIVMLVWPYYRHDPVGRFLETLRTFRSHDYNEYVFYLGRHIRPKDAPWHFPFVMLGVNTPLVLVLFVLAALAAVVHSVVKRRNDRSPGVLVALWFLVPPLVQIVSGAPKYDGVRHYLLVLPALALLAAWAIIATGSWLRRVGPRLLHAGFVAAVTLALALVLRADVALHPYQVAFFNRLAGGTAGAHNLFELDYWGGSLTEVATWLNTHAPAGSRVWLTIPGQHFFRIDASRLHFVNGLTGRPNYKVNLVRGLLRTFDTEEDYLKPKRRPVYAVTVADADLAQVFEYPQFRDLPEGTLLAPLGVAPRDLRPGLLTQVFNDQEFKVPSGPAFTWDALAFACESSPYKDRAMSLRADGYLRVNESGTYLFDVSSDDGAMLFLNQAAVVVNPSCATTRRTIRLEAGAYALRLEYRNEIGASCLKILWGVAGKGNLQVLSAPALAHAATSPAQVRGAAN